MTTFFHNPEVLLNLNQSPAELNEVYDTDYYWYLRSEEFKQVFHKPMADWLNRRGMSCLDVGCGQGQLSEYVMGRYVGIDGSESAIRSARQRYIGTDFRVCRFEAPDVEGFFDAVVFSGILEVLVKPGFRFSLVEMYRRKYDCKVAIVCDLLRLDTSDLDEVYPLLASFEGTAEIAGLLEVKKHRKVRIYRCC